MRRACKAIKKSLLTWVQTVSAVALQNKLSTRLAPLVCYLDFVAEIYML